MVFATSCYTNIILSSSNSWHTLQRVFLSVSLFRFNSSSICDIYTATTHSMTRVNINLPGKDRIQSGNAGRTRSKEARVEEYVDEKYCKGMFCVAFLLHWPSDIHPRHTASNFISPTNYPVWDLWILVVVVWGKEIRDIYGRGWTKTGIGTSLYLLPLGSFSSPLSMYFLPAAGLCLPLPGRKSQYQVTVCGSLNWISMLWI